MTNLGFATATYRAIRERLQKEDPEIDEQTLADTVEGLTDLHEIVAAVVRSALEDESRVTALKARVHDMQERAGRLQDRASTRRQIARDVMAQLDLKRITAPDLTITLRPGSPSLAILDEGAVPDLYWTPSEPRLNRLKLTADLKAGSEIDGVTLSNPEPVLSVRTR